MYCYIRKYAICNNSICNMQINNQKRHSTIEYRNIKLLVNLINQY